MPINQQTRPVYDINRSYLENIASGPSFDSEMPFRVMPAEGEWIDFMGYRIASPLGVPAGPLLNSQWTALAADLGFDVVCYKTIRSQAYAGHPLPNVIFVEPSPLHPHCVLESAIPENAAEISITNSFGMPSMPPEYLQEDISKACQSLKKGQILIVSIVGTPGNTRDIIEDFVRTALMAKEAGAHIIEANFSCPNICSDEGSLFTDPQNAYHIASLLAEAISPLPLLIKVGSYPHRDLLGKVLKALAKAKVRGICGINSLPMKVTNERNLPALGAGRESSGICGNMIRPKALEFIRDAADCIAEESLDLELAGCGGIMLPEHFDEFLNAGAKVAMTATGMMWDPYLAFKWHQQQGKQ